MSKTSEKRNESGQRLLDAIKRKMAEKGLSGAQTAKELGISAAELSRYLKGYHDLRRLSRNRLEAMANFLNTSYVSVMLLSEQITPIDFSLNDTDAFTAEVNRACQFIVADPEWQALLPADFIEGNIEMDWKLFVVHCYEKATGRILVTKNLPTS